MILQGQLWRLVTPVLLHGSILHVGMNMYALFIIGPGVERNYGRIRYLELYLIAGIFGNIFSFLFTSEPSLGASTAIFGLIAAQAVYIYRNRQFFGRAARPMLMNILIIIMINIFIGFLPGIDYWGHLGGLTGGLLFAWLAGPTYSVTETLLGPQLSEKKGISSTTIFILELILAASLVLIGFIFR